MENLTQLQINQAPDDFRNQFIKTCQNAISNGDNEVTGVVQNVLSGDLQLIDYAIYDTQAVVSATSCEFFKDADDIAVGYRNINGGKFEKGRIFVVSGIAIQFVSNASPVAAVYAKLATTNVLGILNMSVDDRPLYTNLPLIMFDDTNAVGSANKNIVGLFKLSNPKLLKGGQKISAEMKFPAAGGATDNFKILLLGTYTASK